MLKLLSYISFTHNATEPLRDITAGHLSDYMHLPHLQEELLQTRIHTLMCKIVVLMSSHLLLSSITVCFLDVGGDERCAVEDYTLISDITSPSPQFLGPHLMNRNPRVVPCWSHRLFGPKKKKKRCCNYIPRRLFLDAECPTCHGCLEPSSRLSTLQQTCI